MQQLVEMFMKGLRNVMMVCVLFDYVANLELFYISGI